MAISMTKWVDITSTTMPTSARDRELVLRVICNKHYSADVEGRFPVDTPMSCSDAADVAAIFGSDSVEHGIAQKYFGYTSLTATKARKMSFWRPGYFTTTEASTATGTEKNWDTGVKYSAGASIPANAKIADDHVTTLDKMVMTDDNFGTFFFIDTDGLPMATDDTSFGCAIIDKAAPSGGNDAEWKWSANAVAAWTAEKNNRFRFCVPLDIAKLAKQTGSITWTKVVAPTGTAKTNSNDADTYLSRVNKDGVTGVLDDKFVNKTQGSGSETKTFTMTSVSGFYVGSTKITVSGTGLLNIADGSAVTAASNMFVRTKDTGASEWTSLHVSGVVGNAAGTTLEITLASAVASSASGDDAKVGIRFYDGSEIAVSEDSFNATGTVGASSSAAAWTVSKTATYEHPIVIDVFTTTYPQWLTCAILAATRYENPGSTVIQEFKAVDDSNLIVTCDCDSLYEILKGMNVNFYCRTQKSGKSITFYSKGYNLNGTDTAVYDNETWLKDRVVTEAFNRFLKSGKIPVGIVGNTIVETAIVAVLEEGVTNGAILVGKTISEADKAAIQQNTGSSDAVSQIISKGYYLAVTSDEELTDANAVVRKVYYVLYYATGEGVRKVEGSHVLV